MKNALASKHFNHPYSMKTARWIRQNFIFEKDEDKRKGFLEELSNLFGAKSAEILEYIGNDYRVFIRDDQLWEDFDDPTWNGLVFSCGRALTCLKLGARKTLLIAGTS